MARRKAGDNKVGVGNITDVGGEVNIAAGDIIKNINTIHPRALTAAEEAARARKLESKLLARGVNKLVWGLAGQVSDSLNQVGVFYKWNETKRGSLE